MYRIGSQLFQLIATSIFNNQRLPKNSVLDLFARTKTGTDIHRHLESILTLFDNEVREIDIIGNNALNNDLQLIASALSTPIRRANESVAMSVKAIFSR